MSGLSASNKLSGIRFVAFRCCIDPVQPKERTRNGTIAPFAIRPRAAMLARQPACNVSLRRQQEPSALISMLQ